MLAADAISDSSSSMFEKPCESDICLSEKWQEFGSSGTSLDGSPLLRYCPTHCLNGAVVVGAFKSRLTFLRLSLGANVSFHVHTDVFIWKSRSFTVFLPAVQVRNGNVAESAVP